MKQALFGLAISAILPAQQLKAGPDELSNWLMSEPASMMDLGLLRADLRYQDVKYFIETMYDWEEDDIVITGLGYSKGSDEQPAQNTCAEFFDEIRHKNFIRDGKAIAPELSSAASFSHYGFTRGRQSDDDFYQGIINKMKIRIYVDFGVREAGRTLECTGPMEGKGFSVKFEEHNPP